MSPSPRGSSETPSPGPAPAAVEPQAGVASSDPVLTAVHPGISPPGTATAPESAETPAEPVVATEHDKQIADLRREAAKHRTDAVAAKKALADAEARLKTIDDAALSQEEKLRKDLADGTARAQKLEIDLRNARVEALAARKGIVDPEACVALMDWKAVADGTSLEDAIDALVERKPYLKAAADGPPPTPAAPAINPSNPSRGASAPITFRRSQLDDIDFQIANRDAILLAYREGRITPD